MGISHAEKRYKYFEDLSKANRQPIPRFALTEYSPAAEERVQHQVEAFATHHGRLDSSNSISASGMAGVDTSHVPNWVYFPAEESNGRYFFGTIPLKDFGEDASSALARLGLSLHGGKKRSHRKKSHKKRSHKKRSHRKSRRH
jgi:hypothetical protein